MIHLKKISIEASTDFAYPFSLPLFKNQVEININSPALILVGENGSGKSTLLKVINSELGLYEIRLTDEVLNKKNKTATKIHLTYNPVKPKGFYFESQKFITYLHYLNKEKDYANEELKRIQKEYKNASEYAKTQASTPFHNTIHEMNSLYSKDLNMSSHGESYLDFFASRIRANQIYLLDEPETPLSTQNQLTLLAMIMDAIKKDSQFIIATHSPILMAIPNAKILEVKNNQIKEVSYNQIESIGLLKQFINHPEQFINHLIDIK
jgi:predicted ATPase